MINQLFERRQQLLSTSEHQGDLMKALLIGGCMLIGLGVVSLAYFASPIRILLQASLGQQKLHLLISTVGAAALLIGIAILFAIRPKSTTNNK